jgi:nucleoside-diphosphate-sugar epimerase
MGVCVVTPVDGWRDREAFIALPYRLQGRDPAWAPPLRRDVRVLLDPRRNPFFEHARARLLLARTDGRVSGRIAAIDDGLHLETHRDDAGFFGFFEAEDDEAVAAALFAAAEAWLGARGRRVLRAVGRTVRLVTLPPLLVRGVLAATGAVVRASGRAPLLGADKAHEILAPAWTCSSDALREDAGWQATVSLDEGLADTALSYRESGWL